MRIQTSVVPPQSLGEDGMRSLYELKKLLLRPCASVGEENDYLAFRDDCLASDAVFVGRDSDGVVRGLYTYRECVLNDGMRRRMIITCDYAVLHPEARGDSLFVVRGLLHVLKRLCCHPFLPKYFFASVFPPGYVAIRRVSNCCLTFLDPRLSPSVRAAFDEAARLLCGDHWDPDHGDVKTRVEIEPHACHGLSKNNALFKEYAHAAPRWTDGYALGILVPISLATAMSMVSGGLQRLIGKRIRRLVGGFRRKSNVLPMAGTPASNSAATAQIAREMEQGPRAA